MSKVVILRCKEYDLDKIYPKIKWAINELGGIESIIPKSKKVLLKPNLVVGTDKKNAATTHPVVFEAVLKLMKENDYDVFYGDSPGIGNPTKVAAKCGIKEVADKYNTPIGDFASGKTVELEGHATNSLEIANAVFEADAIINLPKMKSHALQRITGAVKNPFGTVVGFNKAKMHARFQNAYNFAEMLIDLDLYLKIDLHILDGIIAMEGNGPRNGTPTPMNTIIISKDPVALDAVFCKMIDLDPTRLPTMTYGQEYGLGSYEDIEIIGEEINSFINKEFDIPRDKVKHTEKTPFGLLNKHVLRKPYIKEIDCKKCGICVDVCPLDDKALTFNNDDKSVPPVYDYSKCIRCYCCQEMCPYSAIQTKTPFIGKVIYGLKLLK
ncbi:formate hydrogenlyase complex iron-sulfur subunit [Candidatus Izimaplasma bacterium HR1]|jgi:uncharacterized protein (DUF362 family)/Pyruvate/2-oxoacid:ferredoxin oxidoreductase delta subunit|uniref:DUF362 domain-containing protein n=1 Tax=Candidatus Izimoplasma sp. HR1 TaxID=1541959 RepID=UPI0004F8E4F4|nr:formate hydrogenlyase complex iron-sulfur subunit [Candidatus Izimaplasma bacterium HR1]